MAGRIQIEADRQEIAALPQRYASAADRSDGVALAALFSPEGTLTALTASGAPRRRLPGHITAGAAARTSEDQRGVAAQEAPALLAVERTRRVRSDIEERSVVVGARLGEVRCPKEPSRPERSGQLVDE